MSLKNVFVVWHTYVLFKKEYRLYLKAFPTRERAEAFAQERAVECKKKNPLEDTFEVLELSLEE